MRINRIFGTSVICTIWLSTSAWVTSPVFAAEEANEVLLEEVIVTARRRDEKLMDVPDAITVITDADRQLLILDDLADYLRQVPGAILVNAGPEYLSDISMRGQGGGRIGFSESATGIYRNGSYVAGGGFGGRSLSYMDFFDMESMQVYRGPQGALYGRNAVGGAVNVVSKRPTEIFGGWAKAAYDNVEQTAVEAVLNIPAGDKLGFRLGGYHLDQKDGFISDANTGKVLDAKKQKGARVAAQLRTSDVFTADLLIEFRESDASSFSSLGFREFRTDGVPLDPGRFERDISTDGRAIIEESTFLLGLLWQTSIGDLHADFNYKSRDGDRIADDFDHFIGFQNRIIRGTEVELFSDQSEDFSRFGGVVYLASLDEGSSWNWLFGIEYQSFDDDVETIISGEGAVPPLNALRRSDAFTEDLSSLAIFGSMDFDFAERWNLALEARVQNDEKDFTFDRVPQSSPVGGFMVTDSKEWTKFTPGGTLSLNVTDEHLIYGRIATGYRPGGFNVGIPADIPNVGDLVAYDPEFITSGEFGWKGPFFSRYFRADLAIYYAQTDDVQAVTLASETTSGAILQNAGDNSTWGVEFQTHGIFEVGPGNMRLTLGLASNSGEWKNGAKVITGSGVVDIGGTRVNRTRDLILNLNAAYTFPVGGSRLLAISGSYQSAQGGYENVITTRKLADFDLFDARVTLIGERWKVSIFGKNLTDEIYMLQTVSFNEYFNQGRKYGMSVTVTF